MCALALLVGGCTSSQNGDHPTGSPSPVVSHTPAAFSQHPLPPEKSIINSVTRRKQVEISDCSAVAGGWGASGTAKNPEGEKTTYEITIFFTTSSATVLNFARTSVSVEPGQTAKWTASAKFATPKDTRCVLRGVA